ncbi:MAG: SDR family oxidoreductase [Betaproteobacteria bacterium]|nr:MAG: SDR family oxidoreductase [Betaproteobacteria bacterium]
MPIQTGLSGRVALVTGASKGIGRAVAHALAREGARLVICARGVSELEAAAESMRSLGVEVLAVPTDMTDPAAIRAFVARALERFGRIDILVNNAVTSTQDTFAALSDEEFRYHIDVKLMGYVRCAREVVPHMRANRWGRIVNVAGMTARIVTDFRMTNGIVNSAISNFSKHLSEQVGKDGITVNAIHPGYTWTPRLEGGMRKVAQLEKVTFEEACARRLKEIPIGRFIQPEDLANLVVFLCSESASAITGQAMAVDGGSGRSINY